MSQSLSQLYNHFIFHVKPTNNIVIPDSLQPEMYKYLSAICISHNCPSLITGGTHNHVHILCRMSRSIAPSTLIEYLKVSSSKWLKTKTDEYDMLRKFAWQNGYGVFSVSSSQVENVRAYISNQKEHHRVMSFEDEYRMILKKHQIEYDEKYLWN